MVIKSEKKSKPRREFEMGPKCPVRRSRNSNARRYPCECHFRHVGPYDWLPIPKDKYPEFLADMAAGEKVRAEGKPLDPNMFDKYFEGKPRVFKNKPLANWRQVLKELKEKEAARYKADALKRKKKKEAYRLKKEMVRDLLTKYL